MSRHDHEQGFTVLEMMIVVAIGVSLMTLAVPAFSDIMATSRIRSVASDLHISLLLARSEAVKRNATVTVTETADGWAVRTGGVDLAKFRPSGGVNITTGVSSIAFASAGRITPPATTPPSFLVEASNGKGRPRIVCMDPTGRAYVREGASCT